MGCSSSTPNDRNQNKKPQDKLQNDDVDKLQNLAIESEDSVQSLKSDISINTQKLRVESEIGHVNVTDEVYLTTHNEEGFQNEEHTKNGNLVEEIFLQPEVKNFEEEDESGLQNNPAEANDEIENQVESPTTTNNDYQSNGRHTEELSNTNVREIDSEQDEDEEEPQQPAMTAETHETEKSEEHHDLWRQYHKDLKKKMLLEQLKEASGARDRQKLEKTLTECKHFDSQLSHHKDVLHATHVQEVLVARDDLRYARRYGSIEEIEDEIENIKNKGYYADLQQEIIEAHHNIEMIRRKEQSNDTVLAMDRKTMSEIRRYQQPPAMMHRVIQAALLLLGEDETTTSDWRHCRIALNPQTNTLKTGMNERILQFQADEIHPQIWARAKEILTEELYDTRTGLPVLAPDMEKRKKLTREQLEEVEKEDAYNLEHFYRPYSFLAVQRVSPAAATFYVWAMGAIDSCELCYFEENDNDPKPANESQQLRILKRTYTEYRNNPKYSPLFKKKNMKKGRQNYLKREIFESNNSSQTFQDSEQYPIHAF